MKISTRVPVAPSPADAQRIRELFNRTMIFGHVKECHQPRNKRCPHNTNTDFDCTCKSGRVVVRKPYREIRVQDSSVKMHRISGNIVCRIFGNGLLQMREKGKRTTYETTIGAVFTGRVWAEAMAKARAKKANRRGGRNHGR